MRMSFGGLTVKFREHDFSMDGLYDVAVIDYSSRPARFLDRDGAWVEVKEGSIVDNKFKFIQIPRDALQSLANELAEIGVYQDKVKPYENELTATKNHLEDMRTIALVQHKGKCKLCGK
jgi:hypothetical protein